MKDIIMNATNTGGPRRLVLEISTTVEMYESRAMLKRKKKSSKSVLKKFIF